MLKRFISVLILCYIVAGTAWADGYSGLWWDTDKQGQGVSIIQNGSSICGAWYLYDSSGRDMWLVFTGTLNSSNSISADLLQYTGPPLGTSWDTSKLKSSARGSVTLTFTGTESASMNYSLDGTSGSLALTPFANDSAGFYWDPSRPGQGIGLFTEGRNSYAVWYLYDTSGHDMWVTTPGDISISAMSADLYQFTGPALGSSWDSSLVSSSVVGTASLSFPDYSSIAISYSLLGYSGQLNVVPFTCSVSGCSGSYSGTYTGSAPVSNPDPEKCGYFASVSFVVCNADVTGNTVDNFGDEYTVKGTVDSSGQASGTIYEDEIPIGTFSGSFTGTAGSGTWQDSYGCRGTFSVTKR